MFDLTVGDEDYKRFWADQTMRIFELRRAVSYRGALVLLYWRLNERLREPEWAQASFGRLKRHLRRGRANAG